MADRAEVEIMGTAVLLPPAEITGMGVLLVAGTTGMEALLMAEMMGMVVHHHHHPLVEMTEMVEKAVTRRGTRGMLAHPDGRAPRPGHVGMPPPR